MATLFYNHDFFSDSNAFVFRFFYLPLFNKNIRENSKSVALVKSDIHYNILKMYTLRGAYRMGHFFDLQFNSTPMGLAFFNTTAPLSFLPKGTIGNMTAEDETFTQRLKETATDPAKFKKGLRNFVDEVRKWKEERKEAFFLNSRELQHYEPGTIDMLFTFEKDQDLKNFVVTTDSSNDGGYSSASLKITQDQTALFSGNLSTVVPKHGNVKFSGYANMMTNRIKKSFQRPSTYNWIFYTHMILKVRGDGRTYSIILPTPGEYETSWEYQYVYPLHTRGGPYWQITKIPFSHFCFTDKAKIEDDQYVLLRNTVSRFGITLADNIDGPFRLELDYVGLERDLWLKYISPYEKYYQGK